MRPYFSLRIIIVTVLAFLLTGGAYYVLAFPDPPANPPLGNVVAPLTTGSSTQQRAGQLELIGLPGIKLLLGNAFSIGARDSVGNPRTILFPLTASDNTAINFGPGGNLIINKSAGVERMRIASVGNVGIGTGSPGRKLSVGSNLHSAGDGMTLDGVLALAWGTSVPTPAAGSAFIRHESSDGSIRFKDSGGDTNLVIDDGGNVGIGTAGPNDKLSVSGSIGIEGGTINAYNDATLYVTANNNNDWGLVVNKYNAGSTEYGVDIRMADTASYALRVLGSGAEKFRVDGAGNLFILGGARARLGLPDVWTNRPSITGDTNYWTGSQGWGFMDMNSTLPDYGSTFFDIWGTAMPGSPWGGIYAHIQGIQ